MLRCARFFFLRMRRLMQAFGRAIKWAMRAEAGIPAVKGPLENFDHCFGHCLHNIYIHTGMINKTGGGICRRQPVTITIMRHPLEQRVSFFLFSLMYAKANAEQLSGIPHLASLLELGQRGLTRLLRTRGTAREEAALVGIGDIIKVENREDIIDAMLAYESAIVQTGTYPTRIVDDFMAHTFGATKKGIF